jgi:hypothetical protein
MVQRLTTLMQTMTMATMVPAVALQQAKAPCHARKTLW